MVLYYAADRPVNKNSLLGKFVEGTDMFRDSRFKLIPSIVEVWIADWCLSSACGIHELLTPVLFGNLHDRDIGWSNVPLELKLACLGKQ